MRLRTLLLLGFVALGVVTVTGGWLTRRTVVARFEEEHAARLTRVREGLEAEVSRLGAVVERGLERAAADPEVQELLGEISLGAVDERVARERAGEVAERVDLPILKILDGSGRILSSAHSRESFGLPDETGGGLAAVAGGGPVVVRELDGAARRPALEMARTVGLLEASVVLVGGVFLDGGSLDGLGARVGADVPPPALEEPAADPATVVFELPTVAPGPGAGAWLVARVSSRNIDALENDVLRIFAVLALGVGAVAGALLLVFTRTVTRPIEQLAASVRAVGRGEREGSIELRVGGEIGELIEAFNGMIEGLRAAEVRLARTERLAAWQEIARRMAHEIKNALSPIQLTVQTLTRLRLRDDPRFDEAFTEGTDTILDEVTGLRNLVEEFSRFARLPKPNPEPVDLAELARGVVSLVAKPYEGVTATVVEAPGTPPVRCDRELMRRVLTNLVGNAVEAVTGEGSGDPAVAGRGGAGSDAAERVEGATSPTHRVEVSVGPAAPDGGEPGRAVELRVRDDGPGIAPEARERLFDPYVTTKTKGTGLGLAIVHRIVTDHGGRIEVESPAGGGAELRVRLPVEGGAGPGPDEGEAG